MYSTCLYCTKDLGANEVLETLPIGRRIAFDQRQGRLWVICRVCEKWNLVPFDTRLETIDESERVFRDTRTRFSTDHIGIARTREGLELVRVGPALRPEFAAWRYGDQFGRRRRRALLLASGGGIAVAGAVFGFASAGMALGGSWWLYQSAFQGVRDVWRRHAVAVRLARPEGERPIVVTRADLDEMALVSDSRGWALGLTDRRVALDGSVDKSSKIPDIFLRGSDAVSVLGRVLPKMSGFAGSRTQVRSAVDLLAHDAHPEAFLATNWARVIGPLKKCEPTIRLALEMSAHEESERQALQGELKLLEREWKKAEELAKIADSLAVPDAVETEFEARRPAPGS